MDEKQASILEIRRALDLKIGILITVDKDGCLSMAAASSDSEQDLLASELLSRLSEVLFARRGTIGRMVPANKVPV